MNAIQTWVDWLVLTMLIVLVVGTGIAMIRAKRKPLWIAIWVGVFGIGFLVFEWLGAGSGNTLSENFIASVPLWLMLLGTWVAAVVFSIHWWDLANRLKALARRLGGFVTRALRTIRKSK